MEQTELDAKDLMIRRMGNKIGQLEIQLADAETRAEIFYSQLQDAEKELEKLQPKETEQKPKQTEQADKTSQASKTK